MAARSIEELRARRAARGAADPLARLSAHISRAIASGAPVIEERPMVDPNEYARRFGRVEKAHGNAYAVCWGIGYSAECNDRGFSNPYVTGCAAHVAFNHGADDAAAAQGARA